MDAKKFFEENLHYCRLILSLLILCFFHISSAQRVGIGTLIPSNELSVNGNANITGNLGIGVTSPVKTLEVNGDAKIHSFTLGRGHNNQVNNTAFGYNALGTNTSGLLNTSFGYLSSFANTTGGNNIGIGANALTANTTGNGNVGIGSSAMSLNMTGSSNTAIGSYAGVTTGNLTNATAIGANTVVSASNSLVLGNNANVGIGINAPSTKLEVVGNTKTTNLSMTTGANNGYVMKSDAAGNATWVNINSLESDPKVGPLSIGRIPKWNGSSLIDGLLYDDGTNIGLGTTSPGAKLDIRAPIVGLQLWSGGTGAGNYTSFQIGRTTTEGYLAVAATNDNYVEGSVPGDVILKTQAQSQKLILNSGSGPATFVVTHDLVGIGTTTPVNKLDIEGALAVGASYSGASVIPTNGVAIQGKVGIGTNSIVGGGVLEVVVPFSKTLINTSSVSFFTTNESLTSNPFGLRYSLKGSSSLDNRGVKFQTTDVNLADGGILAMQPGAGNVGIGTSTPATTLDVEGGIRTKYNGSVSFDVIIELFPGVIDGYDLNINPALPAGWDVTNTVLMVYISSGTIFAVFHGARIVNSNTIHVDFEDVGVENVTLKWIAFKM